jgi:hypothetical protein
MTRLFLAACALVAFAAPGRAVPFVQFRLAGTTTGGVAVADEAAYVRLLPDAQTGFDPNDASKLYPFASTYALLAPVGERNGQPYRLSVNSLPDGSPGVLTAPVEVPVDFYTTHAGSFTVRWNGPTELPAGWNAYLRDYTTGAVVDLRQQTVYAFSSGAVADWVGRFQLVLTPAGVVGQLDLADLAGWRLLSAPVTGMTVTTLAGVNLVQGVPAGVPPTTYPPQYPLVGDNLLTGYDGAFTTPATTGDAVEPGRGFFWYWYDAAFTPPNPDASGGGTSRSRDLRGFTLAAYGAALTTDVTRAFPRTTDGNVMGGNPFAASFALSGLSATGGPLATTVQVYDPDGPTYRPLFQSNPGTGAPDVVAPWQGFFAEVQSVPVGQEPALTYAIAATVPTNATFYGRGAPDALAVHLTLSGTTTDGTAVRDEAAWVRLRDGAEAGRDRDDAGKRTPPVDTYALVAPVGEGAARQSVVSLPVASSVVPVAFTATAGGTYELRWDGSRLPDGWTAGLRDLVTGTTVDLRAAEAYTFAAEATDWAERFELALTSAATSSEPTAASPFALGVPVPNPATGVSRLRLQASAAGHVTATVVDALGRTAAVVFDGHVAAGAAVEIAVDATALAPGTYAVRVTGPGAAETRRLVVVR